MWTWDPDPRLIVVMLGLVLGYVGLVGLVGWVGWVGLVGWVLGWGSWTSDYALMVSYYKKKKHDNGRTRTDAEKLQ